MNPRQATLVTVLLAVAAAVVVAPAVGITGVATTDVAVQTNDSDGGSNASEASLGSQLSGFMQASSAGADGSVDSGMWAAEFNTSGEADRGDLVTRRVATLENRLDRLEDRMAAVEAAHENGTLPEPAYVAQASNLAERIDSLESAINQTETAAGQAGVNASRLSELRTNASQLKGREVARLARNLTVITPPGLTRGVGNGPPVDIGPPDDAGPPEDAGPAGNETGRPDDAGPENDRGGRPDDAGGEDAGPPDDAGNGSDRPDAPGGSGDGNDANSSDGTGDDSDGDESAGGDEDDGGSGSGGNSGGGSGNSGGGGGGNPGRGR